MYLTNFVANACNMYHKMRDHEGERATESNKVKDAVECHNYSTSQMDVTPRKIISLTCVSVLPVYIYLLVTLDGDFSVY